MPFPRKNVFFNVLLSQQGEFKVSERYLTMDDLTTALEENRVREMFGSGTACVVCPVSDILYKGEVRHCFFASCHFQAFAYNLIFLMYERNASWTRDTKDFFNNLAFR